MKTLHKFTIVGIVLVVAVLILSTTTVWMATPATEAAPATEVAVKLTHLRYEVSGKVQGVFFRKCTKRKADELGLVGWVQNTARKTVIGEAQGTSDKIESLQQWLEVDSSKIPHGRGSKINVKMAKFETTEINALTFKSFDVDRKGKYADFTLMT